ncbi:hypothetical protein Hanom_Chr11g01055761 [Helianthus anomalus]
MFNRLSLFVSDLLPIYILFIFTVVFLSFWAEVHYNSIYPEGGMFYDLKW